MGYDVPSMEPVPEWSPSMKIVALVRRAWGCSIRGQRINRGDIIKGDTASMSELQSQDPSGWKRVDDKWPHEFCGRLDQYCLICNEPDRHSVHKAFWMKKDGRFKVSPRQAAEFLGIEVHEFESGHYVMFQGEGGETSREYEICGRCSLIGEHPIHGVLSNLLGLTPDGVVIDDIEPERSKVVPRNGRRVRIRRRKT